MAKYRWKCSNNKYHKTVRPNYDARFPGQTFLAGFRHGKPVGKRVWGPQVGPLLLWPPVGVQWGTLIPALCGRYLEVPATWCREEHSLPFLYGSLCYS